MRRGDGAALGVLLVCLALTGCILVRAFNPANFNQYQSFPDGRTQIPSLAFRFKLTGGEQFWKAIDVSNNVGLLCSANGPIATVGTKRPWLRAAALGYTTGYTQYQFEVTPEGPSCTESLQPAPLFIPMTPRPSNADPGIYQACWATYDGTEKVNYINEFCPTGASNPAWGSFFGSERRGGDGFFVEWCNRRIDGSIDNTFPATPSAVLTGVRDNGQPITTGPSDTSSPFVMHWTQTKKVGALGANWSVKWGYDAGPHQQVGAWNIPGHPCCGTPQACASYYNADHGGPFYNYAGLYASMPDGPRLNDARWLFELRRIVESTGYDANAHLSLPGSGKAATIQFYASRPPGAMMPTCPADKEPCPVGVRSPPECAYCDKGDPYNNPFDSSGLFNGQRVKAIFLQLPPGNTARVNPVGSDQCCEGRRDGHDIGGGQHSSILIRADRPRFDGELIYYDGRAIGMGDVPLGTYRKYDIDVTGLVQASKTLHTFNHFGCGGPARIGGTAYGGTDYTGPCNDTSVCGSQCVSPSSVGHGGATCPGFSGPMPMCCHGGCYQMMFADLTTANMASTTFSTQLAVDSPNQILMETRKWVVGKRNVTNLPIVPNPTPFNTPSPSPKPTPTKTPKPATPSPAKPTPKPSGSATPKPPFSTRTPTVTPSRTPAPTATRRTPSPTPRPTYTKRAIAIGR